MKKVILLIAVVMLTGCAAIAEHAKSPLPKGYDKTTPYMAEPAFEYGVVEGRWYGGAAAKRGN